MEATHLPEMLVCIYHTAQSYNPEDHNATGSVQATGFVTLLTCSSDPHSESSVVVTLKLLFPLGRIYIILYEFIP